MVTDNRSGACPHPEQLAAYIDGGLKGEERMSVQRHLADCDACRETVAEAVHTAPPGGLLQFLKRHKPGAAGGGVLALAATLLLVAQVRPDWNPFGRPGPYEALVAAVGTNRTIEGRLTGGFEHGPLRSPTRSGSPASAADFDLLAARARLEELAADRPTPANTHRLGVAHLVLGDHASAVQALEDAAARHPDEASISSDLAAAYLERGRLARRLEDFDGARAAAERASRLDPDLIEPYFNRALALEALSQEDAARGAWREYLSRDRDSAWRDEALARLERLSTSQRP